MDYRSDIRSGWRYVCGERLEPISLEKTSHVSLFLVIFFLLACIVVWFIWNREVWKTPTQKFPEQWRKILHQEVLYYAALNKGQKSLFESKVHEFLLNHTIKGVKTKVELLDRLLIASSAVIPIFSFPEWRYTNLKEVILYPSSFNKQFQGGKPDSNIRGLVGYGFMEGKMLLSKRALREGFQNYSDKRNTAIHEFVHLVDKMDGAVDGFPDVLVQHQYSIPWLELMHTKIEEIDKNYSDIDQYGATSKIEFFAVASEYFFERPDLLSKKHPKLYETLENIFKQDMQSMQLKKKRVDIGRNQPCYCGSGKKFKHCHL